MTNHTKIAIGLLVVSNVMCHRTLKRSLRLNSKIMKESEMKTNLISYMATMIDRNNTPITEFDKVALVTIRNS